MSDLDPPLAKPAKAAYRRNLPHFQTVGKPLFVTFRTFRGWVLPESVRSLVMKHCLHDNGSKLRMHRSGERGMSGRTSRSITCCGVMKE